MMSWTLDILLMSDPEMDKDLTEDWEKEIDRRDKPKIKFPIKATGENIQVGDFDFKDPQISERTKTKKENKKDNPKIIDISKKGKKKNNKTKLF